MIRLKRAMVPNALTLASMCCGFLAIIRIADGEFTTGAWYIIFAAFLDAMDGKVARAIKSSSEFGIEFDSLADMVSCGIAPAFLLYMTCLHDQGLAGVLLAFVPAMCGAYRLARFNIQLVGFDKEAFAGLPIPTAAMTMASYVIFNFAIWDGAYLGESLVPLSLMLSVLMISTIRYETMPRFTFSDSRRNSAKLAFVIAALTLLVLWPALAGFPLTLIMSLHGVVGWMIHHFHEEEEEDEVVDVPVSDQ